MFPVIEVEFGTEMLSIATLATRIRILGDRQTDLSAHGVGSAQFISRTSSNVEHTDYKVTISCLILTTHLMEQITQLQSPTLTEDR